MNATVEKLENNRVKLTFGVDAENFEKSVQYAYNKNKSHFNIPGFRKGKAPRKIIELNYGKEIFHEEAAKHCLPDAYEKVVDECGLDIVSRPEFKIEEISEESGIIFNAVVTLKPEVIISDYKGLTFKKINCETTEDDILAELNKDREKNAREITVTDRPIKTGDIVTIKYEGFIDGVPFEGGAGDDYDLKIGSHSFVDTFEDQLIGAETGDDLTVKVTFPEDYHAQELSGKPAEFKVEIKDVRVRELPELDDDFAADVSEFDTLEEYKEYIREQLVAKNEAAAENSKKDQLLNALMSRTNVEVPDAMIENQIEREIRSMSEDMKAQGLSFELYLQYLGQSFEDLRNSLRKPSEERIKGRLCIEAVAKAENITITPEELDEEIDRVAAEYNLDREKFVTLMTERERMDLEMDLMVQKAMDIIVENSVEED